MSKYKLSKLLGQDAFWMINKDLAKKVGIEAALILSDLISKYEYFEGLGQLKKYDGESYFYYTTESIKEETTIGRRSQDAGIKILIEKCLIKTLVKGTPAKKHFTILEDNILKLLIEKDVSKCANSTNNNDQSVQTGLYETDKLECTKRTNSNKNRLNRINNNTNVSICENSKNEFSPSEQNEVSLDFSLNEKKEKKQKAQKPKSCDVDEPKSYDPSNYVDGIGDGELRDLVGVFYKKNPDKYETVMYKEFLAYWTELPIAGKNKKERWRHQKFFNLSGRLATWAGNFKKAFPAKQFTQPVDHIQKRCVEADNYDF